MDAFQINRQIEGLPLGAGLEPVIHSDRAAVPAGPPEARVEEPLSALRPAQIDRTLEVGVLITPNAQGASIDVPVKAVHDAIAQYLRHELPAPPFIEGLNTEQRAQSVTDILVGSNRIRPRGWKPSEENVASVKAAVAGFIEAGEPIEAVCMFGARKNLGNLPGRISADLGDLLAFERFIGLDREVRAYHAPGIKVRIVMEDLGGRYLSRTQEGLDDKIATYAQSLRTLARMVAPGIVTIEPESEIFAQAPIPQRIREQFGIAETAGITPELFERVARQTHGLFRDYLIESEAACLVPTSAEDVGESMKLPSFRALVELGWRGGVPAEQREYYRARAKNEFNAEATDAVIDDRVARYLSAAFARGRLQLLRPTTCDSNGGALDFLKFSFVPYPPGTPKALEVRRLEYKPSNSSAKSRGKVAPWCGEGGFRVAPDGVFPTIIGFAQHDRVEGRREALVTLTDRETSEHITLQADLFKRNEE